MLITSLGRKTSKPPASGGTRLSTGLHYALLECAQKRLYRVAGELRLVEHHEVGRARDLCPGTTLLLINSSFTASICGSFTVFKNNTSVMLMKRILKRFTIRRASGARVANDIEVLVPRFPTAEGQNLQAWLHVFADIAGPLSPNDVLSHFI